MDECYYVTCYALRDHYRNVLSQSKTTLRCNVVSHWLRQSPEPSLHTALKLTSTLDISERHLGYIYFSCTAMDPLYDWIASYAFTLKWRHNGHDGVSNHQPHDSLLNRLFRPRSKKASKLRITGICEGNSPVTGEFPAQMTSNAENVSIFHLLTSSWENTDIHVKGITHFQSGFKSRMLWKLNFINI